MALLAPTKLVKYFVPYTIQHNISLLNSYVIAVVVEKVY